MCGIAGIIRREGAVSAGDLQQMTRLLTHRGPDGHGHLLHENVGLVHTRLSIIDLSGGQQPLHDPHQRVSLVANGEIYNYLELRQSLLAAGHNFLTQSDSEVVLQAYLQDPEGFVSRLNGMFAFALYDRERRRLILARDRLGIKPLFFIRLSDRILFASEIKALLPLLPHTPAIDPASLMQFLGNQFSTGHKTVFEGIERVLPGEIIEIDDKLAMHRRRYWTPLHGRPLKLAMDDAVEQFDALFNTVMQEHMRSDVPFGLFLSGGNDSAALLAQLTRLQSQPVRTYSVGYVDCEMQDELDGAARMARHFGSQHTVLRLNQTALFRRIPHTIWAADELMRDAANLPTSALAESAASELKVVFSGEGGDEVFGGYGRYRQSPWLYWLKALRSPGSGGFRTRSQWRHRQAMDLLQPLLRKQAQQCRQPFVNAWKSAPASWTHLQHCQYTDLMTALPDNLLVKADRMLMSFALEGRVPFLDHRIVEFGLMLPDGLKCRGREHKRILRTWAEHHIPADHLYQRKRGFHVPIGEWFSGTFLDQLERRLCANRAVAQWFHAERLPALFAAQRQKPDYAREIFCIMQFAIWHYLFIEQPGAVPSADEDPLDWISTGGGY